MITARFSLKIKPNNAVEGDYQMRELGIELSDQDLFLPDSIAPRDRYVILGVHAAIQVYRFAVIDGILAARDAKERIQYTVENARAFLPTPLHDLLKEQETEVPEEVA